MGKVKVAEQGIILVYFSNRLRFIIGSMTQLGTTAQVR